MTRNVRSCAVAVVALFGCEHRTPSSSDQPSQTLPSPPSSRPAQSQGAIAITSLAAFEDDVLVECDDLPTAFAGDGGPNALLEKARAKGSPKRDIQPLPRRCREQFAERAPFATCRILDGAATVEHYRFADVFESDRMMRECLSMRGDWVPMARTSSAFARAQLERDAQRTQKIIDKASRELR